MRRFKCKELNSKEYLEEKYNKESLNLKEIAKLLGVNTETVDNAIKFHNIQKRSCSESLALRHSKTKNSSSFKELNDKDWLTQKYLVEKLSESEIARIVGAKVGATVNLALRKFKIKTESKRPPRVVGKSFYEKLNDKDWLEDKYFNEKLSTIEIGKLVGSDCSVVRQSLKRHGLEVRDRSDGHTFKQDEIRDDLHLNDSVISGNLLGDACLKVHKTEDGFSGNPSFHKSNIYYDHIEFVSKLLFGEKYKERITGPHIVNNGYSTFRGKTYKNKPCYKLSSLNHKELLSIFNNWYPKSNGYKKVIPKDIAIDKEMLLHWFLDDGYSYFVDRKFKNNPKWNKKSIRVQFSTQSFCKDDLFMLSEMIKSKLGLKINPRFHQKHGVISGSGYFMELSETQVPEFFELIGPSPIESLSYKWKKLNSPD